MTMFAEKIKENQGEQYYGSEGRVKYNSSCVEKKSFSGNIIFFSQNKEQYKKRFSMNDCCKNARIATWEDQIEIPEQIIHTSEGAFVDNVVEWEHNGNTVLICSHCGYIFEEKSTVQKTEEQKKSLWLDYERDLFDLDNEEKEPTASEIMQALKEIDLSTL